MKRLIFSMVLLLTVFTLSGCTTVADPEQVVVKDNTAELEALQKEVADIAKMLEDLEEVRLEEQEDDMDEIDELRKLLEDLEEARVDQFDEDLNDILDQIDALEFPTDIAAGDVIVDVSGIELELTALQDELLLLRQAYDLLNLELSDVPLLSAITVAAPSFVPIQVDDDDHYMVWTKDNSTYILKFIVQNPLVGDTTIEFQYIKHFDLEDNYGTFYYDDFDVDSSQIVTGEVETYVAELVALYQSKTYGEVEQFFASVKQCILSETCSTINPTLE